MERVTSPIPGPEGQAWWATLQRTDGLRIRRRDLAPDSYMQIGGREPAGTRSRRPSGSGEAGTLRRGDRRSSGPMGGEPIGADRPAGGHKNLRDPSRFARIGPSEDGPVGCTRSGDAESKARPVITRFVRGRTSQGLDLSPKPLNSGLGRPPCVGLFDDSLGVPRRARPRVVGRDPSAIRSAGPPTAATPTGLRWPSGPSLTLSQPTAFTAILKGDRRQGARAPGGGSSPPAESVNVTDGTWISTSR